MTDPSSSLIASLIYDDTSDSWRIRAPYNVNWIESLKKRVPYGARRWLPTEKIWAIDSDFLEEVKELCDKYLGGWREIRPAAPTTITPEASCWRAFLEVLPVDVLKRAYRDAARILHPDIGNGSTELMAKLNIAFEEIKKARGI